MVRLRGGGLFETEMQLRLDRSEHEAYRQHILDVDRVLFAYREQVAADQAKKAPSGQRYYTDEQLQERQAEHARAAKAQIEALNPTGLKTRLDNLQARVNAIGAPVYDQARIERIRHELSAIKDEPLQLRPYVSTALQKRDGEVLTAIYDWPGHGDGELLKDRYHSEKLAPKVQAWRQTHQAPAESAELQELQAYQQSLAQVRDTALQQLMQEVPALRPDSIQAMAQGEGTAEP